MNSLKSTCVILVLAGVLYGVYVTLNTPQPSAHDHAHDVQIQPPTIDFGPASQAPALPSPGASAHNSPPPLVIEPNMTQPIASPAEAPPTANIPATYSVPAFNPPATAAVEPTSELPAAPPPTSPPPSSYTPPETSSAYTLPNAPKHEPATSLKLEAYKLNQAWKNVEVQMKDGKYRDALAELSPFATNAHITAEDRRAVLNWVDALAAKVIYGPDHYLAEPYRVSQNGQSLYDVAASYKLPVQLLQNINSQAVRDPSVLVRGTELKVIPGPFRAEVHLATGELTLFVGQLYAGRFPFSIGDEKPLAGTYHVAQKDPARAYISRDGRQIPAGDPSNPYGNCWIDLGKNACLHGSGAPSNTTLGCLSFSPQDAQDLYNILSVSSEVVIK
ncbi:L,D-transpeptidase [Anatilimnocola floriformis]|uniref:L,D-transpeptidase n=1 Tax=Anatilimnocola floriformis TaxID=2948575 RepID=UPI0020C53E48|nr:L,D-transpeptidase [Anatilimnocola floriformis]